jgi:ABC-2 type transport system ATP-binding protein
VDALSQTNAKRVSIQGSVNLDSLSGIRDKQQTSDGISFLYSGSMGDLIRTLGEGSVRDLIISEPDLEEIFMHYYEMDGDRG